MINHNCEQRTCPHEQEIKQHGEDIETLKTALGYKNKTNGEFKGEVEKETSLLSQRMGAIEVSMANLDGKMSIILLLMIPLLIAVIAALIKQH